MTDFGSALKALKAGERVSRAGWNGKNMWLFLVSTWGSLSEGPPMVYPVLPFIAMKTAQDAVVPWLASQTDVLAEDWSVV